MGKRNLKQRKKINKQKLEDDKKLCASYVGLPHDKYSTLEIVVCVAAKLNATVKGDIHYNQQIKFLANKIRNLENKKPCILVKKTRKDFWDSRVWKILRYQAFEKYGNRCQCCGARLSDDVVLHVDHIKPASTHPELAFDLNNLQVLCEDCNIGKINQWHTDWR